MSIDDLITIDPYVLGGTPVENALRTCTVSEDFLDKKDWGTQIVWLSYISAARLLEILGRSVLMKHLVQLRSQREKMRTERLLLLFTVHPAEGRDFERAVLRFIRAIWADVIIPQPLRSSYDRAGIDSV